MRFRQPRERDEAFLQFLRSLPCCVCLENTSTEACHIRFSDARVAKPNAGVGAKPSDRWAVPMCGHHHRMQHAQGEREFWISVDIDPCFLAMALYSVSGDHQRGNVVVANATQKFAA